MASGCVEQRHLRGASPGKCLRGESQFWLHLLTLAAMHGAQDPRKLACNRNFSSQGFLLELLSYFKVSLVYR